MKTTLLPFLFLMASLCGYAQIREDTIQLTETVKYCCVGKKFSIDGNERLALGEDEYIIRPLFEDILNKYYKNAKFNTKKEAKRIDYCNIHYGLTLYNKHPNDTISASFFMEVDVLTFNKYGKRFKTCLDSLHNEDMTYIDVISENLVYCICFWKADRLVVFWCQYGDYSEQLLAFIRKQDWLWE